jgi:hypothetical protein
MKPTTLHRLEHAAIVAIAASAGIVAGLTARPDAPPAPAPILYRAERAAPSDLRACALTDTRYLKLPPLERIPRPDGAAKPSTVTEVRI